MAQIGWYKWAGVKKNTRSKWHYTINGTLPICGHVKGRGEMTHLKEKSYRENRPHVYCKMCQKYILKGTNMKKKHACIN